MIHVMLEWSLYLQFHQIGLAVENLTVRNVHIRSGPNADDFNIVGVIEKVGYDSHISEKVSQ